MADVVCSDISEQPFCLDHTEILFFTSLFGDVTVNEEVDTHTVRVVRLVEIEVAFDVETVGLGCTRLSSVQDFFVALLVLSL